MSEREYKKNYQREYRQRMGTETVGSNAVKLNAVNPLPKPYRELQPERQPQPKRQPKKEDVYRTAPRKDVNYAKVNSLCTIVLAFVIIATLGVSVMFLQSHFSVNETSTQIEQVKKDLNQVKRENIQMEEELDSLVDLEYIYEVATTRLGMRIPGENEVFYIKNNPVTYTTKYAPVEVVNNDIVSVGKIWTYIKRGW